MKSCEEKSKRLQGMSKEGFNSICWKCAEKAEFHIDIVESLKCKVVTDCTLCKFKEENT